MSVEAGGGLVWRPCASGVEVVLVHRPKYDDWSFPKGKLEGAETAEAAALREVKEECGLACRLGPRLGSSSYLYGQGTAKVVHYWAMTPEPGAPGPALRPAPEAAHEVDAAEWVPLPEARRRLSYEQDRALLDSLEKLVAASRAEGPS